MVIRGNTISFPNPNPDWAQTTPILGSYIKNKPDITVDKDGFTVIGGQRAISAITINEYEDQPWTMELAFEGGVTEVISIAHEHGNPKSITAGGVTIPITYWGL